MARAVANTRCGANARTVGVIDTLEHSDADDVRHAIGDMLEIGDTNEERLPDRVEDAHGDTLKERRDDGLPDDVPPTGAQKGPMLKLSRCVPSSDASGDADSLDGDAVSDLGADATVAEVHADTVALRHAVGKRERLLDVDAHDDVL